MKGTDGSGLPRVNFRVFVFCALGLVMAVFLYFRIRMGGVRPSDFCFFALFAGISLFPLSFKRTLALALCLAVFAGAGVLSAHLYTEAYFSGKEEGEYLVSGTVVSFTVRNGYTEAVLDGLAFDGKPSDGKLSVNLESETVRAGDIVLVEGSVRRYRSLSEMRGREYLFYNNIRYQMPSSPYEKTGESKNPFLLLSSALYDSLGEGMGGVKAEVAYALLTGNSQVIDKTLSEEVRHGGIAHIFAVSGLHIGILFGAVLLIFRPLKRKAFFPAILAAALYTALCGFSVSSVRALLMCAVLGGYRAVGRKYDFLQSIALAAIAVLLADPADFLSAGFRLSFGACLGLALFSGSFSRAMKKLPRPLASYLAANLSVQLFTFPVLLESFGYFSVWGFLLNFFLIPALPLLFLVVLAGALLALIIPPAAWFFLLAPKGMISLLLFVFAYWDFFFVLTGFSLGMGGVIWLIGSVMLSERVHMKPLFRGISAGVFALLFALSVLFENAVFSGGMGYLYTADSGHALFLKTNEVSVLVIDGIRLGDAENAVARRGVPDAVLVLGDDEVSALNTAAFLGADTLCAKDEVATGLRGYTLLYGDETFGGLKFCYLSREKLLLEAEGVLVEIDFTGVKATNADFFVGGAMTDLKFSFRHGIIEVL